MKDSRNAGAESVIGRRDFIRVAIGAAAAIGGLKGVPACAQAPPSQASSSQGVPWWAARPKGAVGKPEAIDMHSHWSPEPYDKALADLGKPLPNPYPLDYDLDKRRQWMDDHGDLMHCLTLSGAMPWQRRAAATGRPGRLPWPRGSTLPSSMPSWRPNSFTPARSISIRTCKWCCHMPAAPFPTLRDARSISFFT